MIVLLHKEKDCMSARSAITIGLIECALEAKLGKKFNRAEFRELTFRCCHSGDALPSSRYFYLEKDFDKESPYDREIRVVQVEQVKDWSPATLKALALAQLSPQEAAERLLHWDRRLNSSCNSRLAGPLHVVPIVLMPLSLTDSASKNRRPKTVTRSRKPRLALRHG